MKSCGFKDVSRWAGTASRDGVSISDTRDTQWFRCLDGIVGVIRVRPGVYRIKGVYVFPHRRGRGAGSKMTVEAIDWAIGQGAVEVEALAYNPAFYESLGWKRDKEFRPGVWRVYRRVE